MIFFPLVLVSLAWCADPSVGNNTKLLNIYDNYISNETMIMNLFKSEAKQLQGILQQEATAIQNNPTALFETLKTSFPMLDDDVLGDIVVSAHTLFEFLGTFLLNWLIKYIGEESKVQTKCEFLLQLDEMVEAMICKYQFTTSRQFRSEGKGIPAYFEIMNLFRMPERQKNPKMWIRIIFSVIDGNPRSEDSQVTAMFEKKTSMMERNDFSRAKANFFEDVLIRILRLQYLLCLSMPDKIVELFGQNCNLATIVELTSIWSRKNVLGDCISAGIKIDTPTYLNVALRNPNLHAAASFYSFLEMGNGSEYESSVVDIIRSNASRLARIFPKAVCRIEDVCGIEAARDALFKEEAEAAASARNLKVNVPKKTPKSVKFKLDEGSDEEMDDEPTVSTPTVTVTPNEWRPTEVWMMDARVHLAQYCREHILYPALSRKYKKGVLPAGFKWSSLAKGDPNVDFCIAVTSKRNEMVKSDQIFKFLPDLETAYLLLSSQFNVDKKALDFVMKFAPGPRLVEQPRIISSLISENDARYHVTILALYPVCQRVTSLDLKIEEVNGLCAQVIARRNAIAHPTISESFFNLLKKEMLPFR